MDTKIDIEWRQKGNRISFDYKGTEIYFIMPDDYKLSDTHPDLLKLAEWLMFSPWYDVMNGYKFTRKGGKNFGLSFSTGVDSTAAMILQPEAHLIYIERDGIIGSMLKQDNALNMIKKMDREVIRVKTNFELIRTNHNKMVGYPTALAMGVPTVLLADYLDLGYLSFGKVFDDQYFTKGVFRDYTKDYRVRQEFLASAGLIGYYPTVGCSEVITTKIVDNSEYKDLAFSCLRGEIGEQCNKCYKCFRKNLLRDKDVFIDRETMYSVNKNPPKMATSLMFALGKKGNVISELEYIEDLDVSMLSKVYSPAYDVYSDELKNMTLDRLSKLGISKMTDEDEENLKKLDFRRNENIDGDLAEL